MDATTENELIVFCGNPGTGKSTYLNGLLGEELVFKSGFSAGGGLTEVVQTSPPKLIDHRGFKLPIRACDTPGLNDANKQEKCAQEIQKALTQAAGTKMRLVFFFTLESGRVESDDVATMNIVLNAITPPDGHSLDHHFGVVINKIDPDELEFMRETGTTGDVLSCIFDNSQYMSRFVHFLPFDAPMKKAAQKKQRAMALGREVPKGTTFPQGEGMDALRDFLFGDGSVDAQGRRDFGVPLMPVRSVAPLDFDAFAEMEETITKMADEMAADREANRQYRQQAEARALADQQERQKLTKMMHDAQQAGEAQAAQYQQQLKGMQDASEKRDRENTL